MLRQATLPLGSPVLAHTPLAGSASRADQSTRRDRYVALPVRRALEPARRELGFDWTLDAYRGSDLEAFPGRRRDPAKKIQVKKDLGPLLERELRERAAQGSTGSRIAIGGLAEPYQATESSTGATRALLETLSATEGLDLTIRTSAPLVLRDLELLKRLDIRHAITLEIAIPTLDPHLARLLERPAAPPADRLEAVRRFAADGVAVKVVCSPVLPGINSSADELDPLFAAVRSAGAVDLIGEVAELSGRRRRRFFAWLEREFPDLEDLYVRGPTRDSRLSRQPAAALLGTFRRLRLAYGFPAADLVTRG